MRQKFLERNWWENQIKYQPLAQRLFLLFSLSRQFPATLNIEPTNFCNLDCSFCPIKRTNRPRGFLDLKLYQRIIDQAANPKRLKALWLNKDGEPLLHSKIDQMIQYAKKKKVANRVEIYSNGLLLNEKMTLRLIKSGLDSLVISLDAVEPGSYMERKKKDAFDQVVNNIYNFLQIRTKLGTRNPLLSVKMVDFGSKEEIKRFKKNWQGIADCVVIQPLHGWEGSIRIENCKLKIANLKRYPCNLPWLAPAICWDGKMMPCCVNYKENELVMGDLQKQSLKEIWRGERFKKLRHTHLSHDFSQYSTCRQCQFWQQLPNMGFWLRRIGI